VHCGDARQPARNDGMFIMRGQGVHRAPPGCPPYATSGEASPVDAVVSASSCATEPTLIGEGTTAL
jgi:hypothetical protein